MKRLIVLILLSASCLAQQTVSGGTTGGNIYPATTGQLLGKVGQRWDAYLQNLDLSGNFTGSLSVSSLATTGTNGGFFGALGDGTALASYDTTGYCILWPDSTQGAWISKCNGGTSKTLGVPPTFAEITSATNVQAAMVVGTGASLATTGSGTIAATSLTNVAFNTTLRNTIIGDLALPGGTGTDNFAAGTNALHGNTTGSNATAIGNAALAGNTTGTDNVAIGTDVLQNNTTGSDNIGIGLFALRANVGADYNTGVGYNALTANTTGTANTGVGKSALAAVTTGAHNTAIGESTAATLTTGDYNILIGYQANVAAAGTANCIAIGKQAACTGDNQIVLGGAATTTVTTPGTIDGASVPGVFNISGTRQTLSHIVFGRCTLGTDCSITLAGAAVFTSSSSYDCTASDRTSAAAVKFDPSSGSAFALTGTGTDLISFICVGN